MTSFSRFALHSSKQNNLFVFNYLKTRQTLLIIIRIIVENKLLLRIPRKTKICCLFGVETYIDIISESIQNSASSINKDKGK